MMVSFKRWLDRRRNPWKAPFQDSMRRWKRDKGDRWRNDHGDLPAEAVVFDVGGYRGDWTADLLRQVPAASVHVFEPHPVFAEKLSERFSDAPRAAVHAFALGAEDGALWLSDDGDASSALAAEGTVEGAVVSVGRFFDENHIPDVDLAKINIEGGEYDLLPALVESGNIGKIRRLQIQFHLLSQSSVDVREAVRTQLGGTHRCTWCYPFVWEEWVRSDDG
jgi:FkbM family methyltransferase